MGTRKRNRELTSLNFYKGWWCTPEGRAITMEELSHPNCIPWVKYKAAVGTVPHKWMLDDRKQFEFVYDPFTGNLRWATINTQNKKPGKPYNSWHRVKPTKSIYKILLGKIDQIKIETLKIQDPNSLLMGYKGTSILSSGHIYAPYVPLMSTAYHKSFKKYLRKQ